jgi:hypothetical protein
MVFRALRDALSRGEVIEPAELVARTCAAIPAGVEEARLRLAVRYVVVQFTRQEPEALERILGATDEVRQGVAAFLDQLLACSDRGALPDDAGFGALAARHVRASAASARARRQP